MKIGIKMKLKIILFALCICSSTLLAQDPSFEERSAEEIRKFDEEVKVGREEIRNRYLEDLKSYDEVTKSMRKERIYSLEREGENSPEKERTELSGLLRNIATAQETYYVINTSYVSCQDQDCLKILSDALPFDIDINLKQQIKVIADKDNFKIWGKSTNLPNEVFLWDSSNGGLQSGNAYTWP